MRQGRSSESRIIDHGNHGEQRRCTLQDQKLGQLAGRLRTARACSLFQSCPAGENTCCGPGTTVFSPFLNGSWYWSYPVLFSLICIGLFDSAKHEELRLEGDWVSPREAGWQHLELKYIEGTSFNCPSVVCQQLACWYPLPLSWKSTETLLTSWPKLLPPDTRSCQSPPVLPFSESLVFWRHTAVCASEGRGRFQLIWAQKLQGPLPHAS